MVFTASKHITECRTFSLQRCRPCLSFCNMFNLKICWMWTLYETHLSSITDSSTNFKKKKVISNPRRKSLFPKANQYFKKAVSCEVPHRKTQNSSVSWALGVVGKPYIKHWYDVFKSIIIIGCCVLKPFVQLLICIKYLGIKRTRRKGLLTLALAAGVVQECMPPCLLVTVPSAAA